MRIVLSGGGTAGHINPALALAEVLTARGHEVFFAGTPTGVESRLVPAAGISFTPFEASGFDRKHPLSLAKGLRKISKSTKAAIRWFLDIKPDAVVVFGGYVCLPVGRAAISTNVPLIIHEQNSVMGMANDFLSKDADAVCLTYKVAGNNVKDYSKVIVTGNPVRSQVLKATREEGRDYLGIPQDATTLLVFGGSLGARHINTALCAMKDKLMAMDNVHVVHITGVKELDTVKEALALTPEEEKRYQVMGYQDHMGETLAAADLIVSRAGASSLAEISARCIPAVLVPFPYATADHQTVNATEYVERGAAVLIKDDKVEDPQFEGIVMALLGDPDLRQQMSEAAATFETQDAAGRLADVVELMVKRRHPELEEEEEEDDEVESEEEGESAELPEGETVEDMQEEGDTRDAESNQ